MSANNAIYTPNPKTITVNVYRNTDGDVQVSTAPAHLARFAGLEDYDLVATESARVVGRGNLVSDRERYYQVELADGSRHYVVGEGS